MFVCTCFILASLYPYIFRFICPCLHPCILISSGSCVLACIFASSHPQVNYVLACILASSYTHILRIMCACWCPRILTSSYPQVNVFSIRMNNRILASSILLVLSTWASQFVNNLQILRTGQAFVLDFYRTSRKIYHKQLLRADLKKNYS